MKPMIFFVGTSAKVKPSASAPCLRRVAWPPYLLSAAVLVGTPLAGRRTHRAARTREPGRNVHQRHHQLPGGRGASGRRRFRLRAPEPPTQPASAATEREQAQAEIAGLRTDLEAARVQLNLLEQERDAAAERVGAEEQARIEAERRVEAAESRVESQTARADREEAAAKEARDQPAGTRAQYLRAMAEDLDAASSTAQVASRLNRAASQLTVARSSLISKGLVYAPDHGAVRFTVPGMSGFISRQFEQ
jgi:hypothetical protein